MTTAPPLVRVNAVKKHYPVTKGLILQRTIGQVKAVDGISFEIPEGQTYSLVGESGCGKTTTSRMILMVEPPTEGEVYFEGQSIQNFSGADQKNFRASVQAVFQDPWSSLNPRMKVNSIISEPITAHRRATKQEIKSEVNELLSVVGLHPLHGDRYPHEFSGGQRQRIAIARALSSRPKLIVLDEPVSALDVSIRAQILNLLKGLQKQYNLSFLLIAHNLATVRYMSHKVGVMYLGQLCEVADSSTLFARPRHPYTHLLLDTLPDLEMSGRERVPVAGEVPSPIDPPPGCGFHPRCPFAEERCTREKPLPIPVDGGLVACHAVEEGRLAEFEHAKEGV